MWRHLARSRYRYRHEEVTTPCNPNPCRTNELCSINRNRCAESRSCSTVICTPGKWPLPFWLMTSLQINPFNPGSCSTASWSSQLRELSNNVAFVFIYFNQFLRIRANIPRDLLLTWSHQLGCCIVHAQTACCPRPIAQQMHCTVLRVTNTLYMLCVITSLPRVIIITVILLTTNIKRKITLSAHVEQK